MGQYREALEKAGGVKAQAARELGLHVSTFNDRLKLEDAGGSPPPPGQVQTKTKRNQPGLSKAEFMRRHDPIARAQDRMSRIPEVITKGRFYSDWEVCKSIGLSGARKDFQHLARDPDEGWLKYQFRIGKDIWWTDPESRDEILAENPNAYKLDEEE